MFTSAAGYRMPLRYRNAEEEHQTVRERVGMEDLSLMGRLEIKGKQSLELVQKLAVNDAEKLVEGQLMYTTLCNDLGGIVDDLTVWRFGPEHFRIVTSSIMRHKTYQWIENHIEGGMDVSLIDISSGLGMISVQGPRSRETLQKISDADLSKLKFFHFTHANLGGVPTIVARVGFTGELGFECYFATEDTVEAWNAIGGAGKEFGLLPYGFDALDSLRYEKGYIFYGLEITEKNNPFECGLEKWIAFDKGDFIGSEALLKIRNTGAERKLIGLEVTGDSIMKAARQVKAKGNKSVGETVVGFWGLTLGKNLAWAFVDSEYAREGDDVTIGGRETETKAKLVSIRYYDPTGKRMKM